MAFYSDVEIRLRNKVSKAYLGCTIDLQRLRAALPDKYTVRENFPGLVYRGGYTSWSSGTVLIFSNGSIIITGVDSDETIKSIVRDVAQDLRRLGYNPSENIEFKVVNSVAQFRIRRPVDIVAFSKMVGGAKLDSSRFRAVTWRDPETGCTIRLFRNGAGVVLGSGDPSKIKLAVNNAYKLVLRLGLTQSPNPPVKPNEQTGQPHLGVEGEGGVPKSVDRAVLEDLLNQVFGPSISKTVMRNLDAVKGENASYTLKDVGHVLFKLLGEYAAKSFLKRLGATTQGGSQ